VRARFQNLKLCPWRDCTASATLSSAENSAHSDVIWNERANPLRDRVGASSAVTSSPARRIDPDVGSSSPASWAISVVFPAPFGPMTACRVPASTRSETPEVATMPPNLL
jgi:hypothetical protein